MPITKETVAFAGSVERRIIVLTIMRWPARMLWASLRSPCRMPPLMPGRVAVKAKARVEEEGEAKEAAAMVAKAKETAKEKAEAEVKEREKVKAKAVSTKAAARRGAPLKEVPKEKEAKVDLTVVQRMSVSSGFGQGNAGEATNARTSTQSNERCRLRYGELPPPLDPPIELSPARMLADRQDKHRSRSGCSSFRMLSSRD